MTTKDARGTKLTCQSDECGAKFYDLNREPATCPICGKVYEVATTSEPPVEEVKEEIKVDSGAKAGAEALVEKDPETEVIAELEDIVTDDALTDDDDSDTFLETDTEVEEDNVKDIVGVKKDTTET